MDVEDTMRPTQPITRKVLELIAFSRNPFPNLVRPFGPRQQFPGQLLAPSPSIDNDEITRLVDWTDGTVLVGVFLTLRLLGHD